MHKISSATSCPNCGYSPTDAIAIPSSPVPTLLRSPIPPSPSEAKLIRSTLSHVHSNISAIDEEIVRVQAILDSLNHKREKLQTYADEHQALVAPVRRFPPELLAEAFMHCLPAKSALAYPAGKLSTMHLSQVCRYWRDVALSTPKLWSSINLPIRERNCQSRIALAKVWLSRTGNCPLTITVKDEYWEIHDTQTVQLIVDTFLPYCNRWQHAKIRLLPMSAITMLAAARNNLPCLESLALDSRGPWDSLVNTFEFAPKLRTLELGHRIKSCNILIPWSQLTGLVVHNNFYQCHAILTLVPNIVHLGLRLQDDSTPSLISYPIIQLPQLTKLELFAYIDAGPLLDYLSLPALRDFYYKTEYDTWNQERFISLLSRSSCSLWRLGINNYQRLREDELSQILEHTPYLVELLLPIHKTYALTAEMITRLTYRQAPCLVPRLRLLDIYRPVGFDDKSFVDMIESRWRLGSNAADDGSERAISRIQTVKLRWAQDFDRLALVRCRQLLVEGMDLQLMVMDDEPLDYNTLLGSM